MDTGKKSSVEIRRKEVSSRRKERQAWKTVSVKLQ